MMNLNRAQVIGNATRDPEVRTTPSGQTVASFAVATNLRWTDASGQSQEKVEFHNIVAWRRLGEICGQYVKKGRQLFVEGRLQTRDWTGQDGVRRYRTEIVADNVILLGSPAGSQGGSFRPAPAAPAQNPMSNQTPIEDIPVIDQEMPTNMGSGSMDDSSDADTEENIKVENIPF
ncbi:MAG: single-stranded DNA-binding protein [bacterium]|nr:single-stranded DNA-binding protein [bacterium]